MLNLTKSLVLKHLNNFVIPRSVIPKIFKYSERKNGRDPRSKKSLESGVFTDTLDCMGLTIELTSRSNPTEGGKKWEWEKFSVSGSYWSIFCVRHFPKRDHYKQTNSLSSPGVPRQKIMQNIENHWKLQNLGFWIFQQEKWKLKKKQSKIPNGEK